MDRIPTNIDQLTALVYSTAQADQRDGAGRLVGLRDQLVAQEGAVRAAALWESARQELSRRTAELARETAAARSRTQAAQDRLAREVRDSESTPDFAALFPAAFEAAYMEAAGALLGTMHAAGDPNPLATESQHEAFRLACVAAFNAGVRCDLAGTEG